MSFLSNMIILDKNVTVQFPVPSHVDNWIAARAYPVTDFQAVHANFSSHKKEAI